MKSYPLITFSTTYASELLTAGEVVAIPTETVYGLGANATSDQSVAKIYEYKNRPKFNPLIVHVLDLKHASKYVEINKRAELLADAFWPGPLTMVLPLKTHSSISLLCTAGLKTLAIRAPRHPIAQEILEKTRIPLAAPSANLSTLLSPTSAQHVQKAFKGSQLTIVEGGECEVGLESTIIDISSEISAILRYGAISKEQVNEVLKEPVQEYKDSGTINAPGQMLKHYSPYKPIRINVLNPSKEEGYLVFGKLDLPSCASFTLNLGETLQEAAANLFKMLHQLDDMPIAGIAVAPIPNEGVGIAINDRLARACGKIE